MEASMSIYPLEKWLANWSVLALDHLRPFLINMWNIYQIILGLPAWKCLNLTWDGFQEVFNEGAEVRRRSSGSVNTAEPLLQLQTVLFEFNSMRSEVN